MKTTKRIMIALISALLCFSLVACGSNGNEGETTTTAPTQTTTGDAGNETTTGATEATPDAPVAESALDLFQQIWTAYMADTTISEETKLSFVMGGDEKWNETVAAKTEEFATKNPNATEEEWIAFNATIMGPGSVEVSNVDFFTSMSFPSGKENLLVSAASVMHGMNRNMFTGAVYETKSAEDAKTLAEALKTSIPATAWVCGQPDLYTVVIVDDFVIAIFGAHQLDPEFGNMTPVEDMLKVIENLFDNETVLCKDAAVSN